FLAPSRRATAHRHRIAGNVIAEFSGLPREIPATGRGDQFKSLAARKSQDDLKQALHSAAPFSVLLMMSRRSLTRRSICLSWRLTRSTCSAPSCLIIFLSSGRVKLEVGWPSTARSTSPARRPASAAGEPGRTRTILVVENGGPSVIIAAPH